MSRWLLEQKGHERHVLLVPSVSAERGDILVWQARRHFQSALADEHLAVVVDRYPCCFGTVITVKSGLDQAIEIPDRLSIDRQA